MTEQTGARTLQYVIESGGALDGRLRVPGDKSISHRAMMLGALAEGCTEIRGFLEGEDCLATVQALTDLGVDIRRLGPGRFDVHGVGMRGLKAATGAINLGNSGTAMRLMVGLLAGQHFDSLLTGDASLSRRPMRRVTEPLATMGAQIEDSGDGTPPLQIRGTTRLRGTRYVLPVPSAQVKSCLLLAGLFAEGETCVVEPAPTRDHTERMLQAFGCALRRRDNEVCLHGGEKLQACPVDVPADLSSAAFFMVAGSIASQAELVLEHVGVNPTRTGAIEILRLMGADIELLRTSEVGGEPVADIRVRSAPLHGINIPESLVPLAIDEFPALFIAAACADGETTLSGAAELRVKESDRIETMVTGLRQLGIEAHGQADGATIRGGELRGGRIQSQGDHRVAMAFAVAGTRAQKTIVVDDCANVDTSFPGFVTMAKQLGMRISANCESEVIAQ